MDELVCELVAAAVRLCDQLDASDPLVKEVRQKALDVVSAMSEPARSQSLEQFAERGVLI